MIHHSAIEQTDLRVRIKAGEITLGGNSQALIYGRLDCAQGKRLDRASRVFFTDEADAVAAGYRPCGGCMRAAYQLWKTARDSVAAPDST